MAEVAESGGPPPLMGENENGRGRGWGQGGFRGRGGEFRGGRGGEFRGGRGGEFRGSRGGRGDFRGGRGGERGRGGSPFRGRGGGGGGGEGREQRGRGGFRGGRGGMGQPWTPEDRVEAKLMGISGPTYDLPSNENQEPKKFTNKCRLFVGNLTEGTTLEEFTEMFQVFGETTEPYLNPEKAFGFIKLDYRESAEKARQALNGSQRNGRVLKVRFSAIGCSLRVKRLSPWISNELLELAFGVFGELERAVVVVDDRGKSTGVGILEFAKKPCATQCLKRCTESSFFLTESLQPVEIEPLNEQDDAEGLCDQVLPRKNQEYQRERSLGPRLATPGSFEMEYGNRWKQLYELEKQRRDQLDQEMRLEAEKLKDQMELARREHETEMLREQLRQREMEQQRTKDQWQLRQQQLEQERHRIDEAAQRRQEMIHGRGPRQPAEDGLQRQQHSQLFMRANEMNALLDQHDPQGAPAGGWGGDSPQQQPPPQQPPPPVDTAAPPPAVPAAAATPEQDQPYTTGVWSAPQDGGYGMPPQGMGGRGGGRGRGGQGMEMGYRGRGGFRGGRSGDEQMDFANKRPRLF